MCHQNWLVPEATQWHRGQQLGAAGPSLLCGETLLEFYLLQLNTEFDPCKQHGKLLEYEVLSLAGESPRCYLGDVRQLERFMEDSYPKHAIA